MYLIRDDSKSMVRIQVAEGAWKDFFEISRAIHSDKTDSFKSGLTDQASRNGTADLAAATVASLYRAGKLPNQDVEEMLELCGHSLSNHQFRSNPKSDFCRQLFQVEHVVTAVLGCQNLETLKRRAAAAVSLCADSGKAMRLVPSGLRPPHGIIRTSHEYHKLREFIETEIAKRGADIFKSPDIFPVVHEAESSNTVENIKNVLTKPGIIPSGDSLGLVIVSSTFHLMQIAKIINQYFIENAFGIRERFQFVGLVGAERPEDAQNFKTHDWQYVKQLAFQLYLDQLA